MGFIERLFGNKSKKTIITTEAPNPFGTEKTLPQFHEETLGNYRKIISGERHIDTKYIIEKIQQDECPVKRLEIDPHKDSNDSNNSYPCVIITDNAAISCVENIDIERLNSDLEYVESLFYKFGKKFEIIEKQQKNNVPKQQTNNELSPEQLAAATQNANDYLQANVYSQEPSEESRNSMKR